MMNDLLQLDCKRRILLIGGRVIVLRNKEFELLKYFFDNPGRLVTRTQLLEEVWDMNICCATNTVDVHVSSLRQKLRKFSLDNLIRTVHCAGYIAEF